jgi:FMN-dependent NADH-azoreductase
MCNITHIGSSPLSSASYSKQVAEDVIRELREKDLDASLTVCDLENVPLSHVDDFVAASSLGPRSYQHTNDQSAHTHSVWRKFLDAVLEPRTVTEKNEVFEYLHRYRHDLPPAVMIENGPPPLGNGR